MMTENKSKPASKKRKHYLPHNKPGKQVAYSLRPRVQGFFITCDGGREHQASHEAINVLDSFYEELLEGGVSKLEPVRPSAKPLVNKLTKFSYSDSSSDDDGDGRKDDDANKDVDNGNTNDECSIQMKGDVDKPVIVASNESRYQNSDRASFEERTQGNEDKLENQVNQEAEAVVPPFKKQCVETDQAECVNGLSHKVQKKSVDKLIEAELAELGDRSKRRFIKLDPGCNGVVFIQMSNRDGDPGPKDVVQHMVTSLASTRKHMSRFLLRVLPIEITCYASEDEIKRAIKPLIDRYFPGETPTPIKFAVIYESRSNTGIDRTKIIEVVAKSVPPPHKVDLSKPDLSIVVQIVKTLCLVGVVEKYKELAKYNIRQLTSTEKKKID